MTQITTIERAKAQARILRTALSDIGHDVAHGQALDLLARLEGVRDWNALVARLTPMPTLGPIPKGWRRGGDKAERFDMGLDEGAGPEGAPCATIRLRPGADPDNAFGTLMQSVDAAPFLGTRVALTAHLRAEDVAGAVTIWLRADGTDRSYNLAFDNLEDRQGETGPLAGTMGWERRRIVLDIPEGTVTLAFGFYLRGSGQGWCADMELAPAPGAEVTASQPIPAPEPVNMGLSG
ncbi:glyoxalase superfamily protein [Jannaschia pohangensis]|uniref:Glyoxalase-related protein domain-containing protein n=1 Tax=Jannaschia pohangensis TaxID=390807 RepID=A0A1I3JQS0_9RHOB|nr:glyoxalase superfamily protein [Jannaschia pohangensis]SFI62607.1 hypothetical protein SAMN04488095_1400 [Jannaschia pohangensis]